MTDLQPIVNNNNNESKDILVIPNTKYPDRPPIKVVKFFNYFVRSIELDGVDMYLANDISRQYSLNENKNKIFITNFLRLDKTKTMIEKFKNFYDKQITSSFGNLVGQSLVNDPLNNKKYDKNFVLDKPISNNYKIMTKEQRYALSSYNFNVTGIIHIINLEGYEENVVESIYVMCEKLLIQYLMWIDVEFALSVSCFLERLRHQDNDFLEKNLEIIKLENNELKLITQQQADTINTLQTEISELTTTKQNLLTDITELKQIRKQELLRYVRDVPSESFCLYIIKREVVKIDGITNILLSFGFRNQCQLPQNFVDNGIVLTFNLPSGHQIRTDMKKEIYDVLADYNGYKYIDDYQDKIYHNTVCFKTNDFTDDYMYVVDNAIGIIYDIIPSKDLKSLTPKKNMFEDIVLMVYDYLITNNWNTNNIFTYENILD